MTVPASNRLGLEDHIEMEGLVYRLRPYKIDKRNPINEERMWTNLMSGYNSEIWQKDIEAREWLELEDKVWSKDYKPGYLYRNLGSKRVRQGGQGEKAYQQARSCRQQKCTQRVRNSEMRRCKA